MISETLRVIAQVSIDPSELKIPQTGVSGTVADLEALDIIFAVIAAVAVLVMVIAGVQFMLSRGEPQKIAKARNAIIYASIGLALAFLAFGIVQFVLGEL